MTLQIHVGKSVDFGPITLFSHFTSPGSPDNVIDETTSVVADCPSGRCRVGFHPDGRTLFVDALSTTTSSVRITISALSTTDFVLVDVVDPAPAEAGPKIIFTNEGGDLVVSAEYDTPDRS